MQMKPRLTKYRRWFDRKDVEAGIAITLFIALLYVFSAFADPRTLKAFVLDMGIGGPMAIILIQVAFSILAPLPNSIPVLVAGSLYGTVPGALYAGIGSVLGAVICFWLARRFGRKAVVRFVSEKNLMRADNFFEHHGFAAIFFARLIPFFSFDAVSYGSGLTDIDFWKFIAATTLGMIPGTLLYAFIGNQLTFEMLVLFMAALVLASGLVLYIQVRNQGKHPALGSDQRKPR